ncbi:2TM domain-containing protein [Luteirhabdus pelagi]|uniref:2TM domain-containing protein n=1 Tax=Luteirhabdus pelagi TaxID=2792783 RepID=UPI001939FF17|nr:2TM domain-containing protein [Luteirhabdus pelagi]
METTEENYRKASKKLKALKEFYAHLTVYIILSVLAIIGAIIVLNLPQVEELGPEFKNWVLWSYIITWAIWGIAILIHWYNVSNGKVPFFRKWEERKIKELLDEEENNYQSIQNRD